MVRKKNRELLNLTRSFLREHREEKVLVSEAVKKIMPKNDQEYFIVKSRIGAHNKMISRQEVEDYTIALATTALERCHFID